MPYNLRQNPQKRLPYSPPNPQQNSKNQKSNSFVEENTAEMSQHNLADQSVHRLLEDVASNHSNQVEMDYEGLNPDDNAATENVRRLLGIPPTQGHERLSLPPSNTLPPLYNPAAIPRTYVPSPFPMTNMTAPRTGPASNNNHYQVPVPPRYPFLTPPPPLSSNNDTNRLLSILIEKLDRGFEETRNLRQEWTNFQATASSRGSAQSNHPRHTSNSAPTALPTHQMSNEQRLEQRVTTLTDQLESLTERLNSTHLGSRNSSHSYRVPPHKWNVRFTKMTAESFIFQITSLKQSNAYEWNEVLACFHQFLEGNVLTWYWKFRSTIGEEFNWDTLSTAILTKYGNRKTDEEIWLQMAERKQDKYEKFKDFYEAIESIHSLCREPRSDKALMKLIRSNSKRDIQKVILTYEPDNLNDFIQKCEDCDQMLFPYLYKPNHSSQDRRTDLVSSLEFTEHSNEALSFKGCLNCGQPDHFVKQCDKPIQLFCYKCNKKGFTVRSCPDCNQNFQVNELKEEPPPQI